MDLTYTKKVWEELLYENGAGKKDCWKFQTIAQSWAFFWAHGEHEWPLLSILLDLLKICSPMKFNILETIESIN